MTRVASIRPHCRLHIERVKGRVISPAEYADDLLVLIEAAAKEGATFIGLPEDALFMMQAGADCSDEGTLVTTFSAAAKRLNVTLLVGLVRCNADVRFNSIVVFMPDGQIAGEYHKTHLTLLEKTKYRITPGDRLPVFDLPMGRVGIMTCSDILFPEVARVLALRGAQLIFFPHQMAEPDERFFTTMLQSRAQDNCVPIVSANFADEPGRNWYRNYIVGADGAIVAEGPLGHGFAIADLELGKPVALQDYIEPGPIDLRRIIHTYRRPELYRGIGESEGTS